MGLSTHVLDTALGRPAVGVEILLSEMRGSEWQPLAQGTTDSNGRCKTLLGERDLEATTYKLTFFTSGYYKSLNTTGLYPHIEIVFDVDRPDTHYHIPLLLTANGYTTYRGS